MQLPDYAIPLLDGFTEAALLMSSTGSVLAANANARAALSLRATAAPEADFAALVMSTGDLAAMLRSWSRSTQPMPGSFTVQREAREVTFNAKGSVIIPPTRDDPALLLVRFWPRAEANPFVLLNQKIAQLNAEISRRVQVEEALRRSESALRERVREAEALNRTRDEFLATVSHELRTPLNVIVGWSSMLRAQAVDGPFKKGLDVIFRNAQAQASLIEDILDVSRIVTGKMRLEAVLCDLVTIANEAVEVVSPSAEAKRLELIVDRPAEPCLLVGDPNRLRQVVWNLLSNAVKFTERSGKVVLRVERSGSSLTFSVSDTGCGIEPEFLPFVFDRFSQSDGSTTRRFGGLGLGLAIVRHMVELHGGSVRALSEGRGQGATFIVVLPIGALAPRPAEVDAAEAARSSPPRPPELKRLEGVRVLVVDDDVDARDLLVAVLTDAGAEVGTAGSVSEAMETRVRLRPDVIISDIGMPNEDGYSFIRRLRALEAIGDHFTPSIALTAYTRAGDRDKALAAGFTMHLGKPVTSEDLLSAVFELAALTRRDS